MGAVCALCRSTPTVHKVGAGVSLEWALACKTQNVHKAETIIKWMLRGTRALPLHEDRLPLSLSLFIRTVSYR